MVHQVRRIPIMKHDFYQAGSRLSSALFIPLHPANGFLRERELAEIAGARACNCSGNDKADSVATSKVQGDMKTENEWEGKVLFYGALNSDEVFVLYTGVGKKTIRIILEQINRPPTK